MKTLKANYKYEIDGTIYELDREDKNLAVGTIVYDSRKQDFVLLESRQDLSDMSFVAPELYGVLKPCGVLKNTSLFVD